MKNSNCFIFSLYFLLLNFATALFSQNETNQWYFGNKAALDFNTSPPTSLNNSQMFTWSGCASISDAGGNLLFYTSGDTIWNQQHNLMANGTGLFGNKYSRQSALIVKQPGSNHLYYVFTEAYFWPNYISVNGSCYSVVDMNLAAGMGSVTVKNVFLNSPCIQKLAATKHCNGTDVWVLTHDYNSNNFRSYLVTASGVNTVAVVSAVGGTLGVAWAPLSDFQGQMKISPTGKKIASSNFNCATPLELFDFDNISGVVSNPLSLPSITNLEIGCEFSPDGTKLYTSSDNDGNGLSRLVQWNLCAGSNQAIINSGYMVNVSTIDKTNLQLGSDRKIYVSNLGLRNLGVINNPNAIASNCNYVDSAVSIAPNKCWVGLPNFVSTFFQNIIAPISYTASCQKVQFTFPSNAIEACVVNGYSLISSSWSFGDPLSSNTNTSTLLNPSHFYSTPGTYTAQLFLNYTCRTETLTQVINVTTASPLFSVNIPSVMCKGETYTLTPSNASNTYSWNSYNTSSLSAGVIANSVVISPTTTSAYTVTATNTITGCNYTKSYIVSVNKCTALEDLSIGDFQAKIYPNPSTGSFIIESKEGAFIKVKNLLGADILETNTSSQKHTIDLSNFANGLYFVFISYSGKTQKIKIQKTN